MPSRNIRARAADRDGAVEIIEAAYVDGQLSREEYDSRSQAALEASTLGELRATTKDLQAPPDDTAPPSPGAPRGLRLGPTFAVIAVLFVGVWLVPRLGAGDVDPSGSKEEPPRLSLLRADGFSAFVDELEERSGDSVILWVDVVGNSGEVIVPADQPSDRSIAYIWGDAGFSDDESASTTIDGIRFDLQRIDPEAIPQVVEVAEALVDEPEGTGIVIEVDEDHPRQCFEISSSNRFDERATVYATCSGEILRTE